MPPRTRSTRSSRSSSAIDIPEETPDNALRTQVTTVFREAQRTTASHRKLVVTLRKIQEACCYEPATGQKQSGAAAALSEFDEDDFNTEFVRCALRILPVKKSEGVGEKTVRFVSLFLRHAIEKDNELLGDTQMDEDDADNSTMPETPSTRLTSHLMETILPMLMAKDKFVRYRAAQLLAHIVNSLDAIDDDLYQKLRAGLLRRIHDKEPMVRAQAVLGLGRLAGNALDEEPGAGDSDLDGDDDGPGGASGVSLMDKLMDVMKNDPSADVRRTLLVNLPITPKTLPSLLERARDQDPATRRAVYSRLLPALGDFRHLSLSMREKLLRWGLRDRDENVRKAAARLFRERWIEDCAGTPRPEPGQPIELSPPNMDALLELLERIDVVNSGGENGIALEAMRGFWEGRPDYRDAMVFDDHFFETLSAESVFALRTFNDFCRNEAGGKYEALIEEKLPEVTKLAFYLERYIKVLIDAIKRAEEQGEEEEEDTAEQEFIVEQLLHIALTLDYADEVGRRKMFALLRQTLSIPELPEECTKLTVMVLRDLCAPDAAGEKEFTSVVLEAVADVHDTIVDEDDDDANVPAEDDESFVSARSEVSRESTPAPGGGEGGGSNSRKRGRSPTPKMTEEEAAAKAIREIMINMKCLHIVQCMLQNVQGQLQSNDNLISMLNNLVVPAVRSHEAPVRERGLVCLGLCALLDRSLAEENLTLFIHFFAKGHTALQITALHILTDILVVHGAQLLSANPTLLKVYVKALRSGAKHPELQAVAVVAASKLLLGRVVSDRDVAAELLKTLVVAYFEPASAGNQSVRQALNYFLPVFCYSRAENQDLMRRVALDALHTLYNVREGFDDDDADIDDEMVSLATIGACLVDWTDPRKVYTPDAGGLQAEKHVNADVHLDFAKAILERLEGNVPREEKKVLASLLSKLYISPASSPDKTRETYRVVSAAVDTNLLPDTTSRNALYKIHVSLGKIVNALDGAVPSVETASVAGSTGTGIGTTTTAATGRRVTRGSVSAGSGTGAGRRSISRASSVSTNADRPASASAAVPGSKAASTIEEEEEKEQEEEEEEEEKEEKEEEEEEEEEENVDEETQLAMQLQADTTAAQSREGSVQIKREEDDSESEASDATVVRGSVGTGRRVKQEEDDDF